MAGDVDRTSGDPQRELMREVVLTARAERRLIEHELTRRRVLLIVTVALLLAAAALALVGHPYAGAGACVTAAGAMRAATTRRRA